MPALHLLSCAPRAAAIVSLKLDLPDGGELKKSFLYIALGVIGAVAAGVAFTHPSFTYRAQRQVIASALKDPDSAKFKDERVAATGSYCAEVNSKNSYGAYGGFKRIISDTACTAFFDNGSYHIYSAPGRSMEASNCEGTGYVTELGIRADAMEAVNAALKAETSSKFGS